MCHSAVLWAGDLWEMQCKKPQQLALTSKDGDKKLEGFAKHHLQNTGRDISYYCCLSLSQVVVMVFYPTSTPQFIL